MTVEVMDYCAHDLGHGEYESATVTRNMGMAGLAKLARDKGTLDVMWVDGKLFVCHSRHEAEEAYFDN